MYLRVCLMLVSTVATVSLLKCDGNPPPDTAKNTNPPAPTEMAKKPAPVDLEALSNRLVTQVAGVKEGEIVFVSGGVRDMELLENITTDVRKVGAFPMLTVNSDRMFKKYYEEVPEKYDSQSPDLDLKLATLPSPLTSTPTSRTMSPKAFHLLASRQSGKPTKALLICLRSAT